jgi:L-fucose isomerase-like protein
MNSNRKPKIGLAGVMCIPFRGNKEDNYSRHRVAFESLAVRFGFEFYSINQGIYSKEQAEAAARELKEWGADFIILQSASFGAGDFIYPFSDLSVGLGVWAVPEGKASDDGGLPLNSFTGANLYNSLLRTTIENYKHPVKWFWGNPGQDLFDTRLLVTVQALRALVNLRGARIGLIGGVAPSFDNLIINEQKLKERLGVTLVEVDLDDVFLRAQKADSARSRKLGEEIRSMAAEVDPSMNNSLLKSSRTLSAIVDLAKDHNLQGVAVSCWPRFQTDEQLAVCTVMGHLNSIGLIAACEGDVTSAVSMFALHCMSNGDVVTLMDLVTLDPQDESVLLWHCGPTSPLLADSRGTRMEPLSLFENKNGEQIGLHNDLVLKPGKATVLGFTVDFEQMLILDGDIDNQKPSYKGSRGWLRNLRLNGKETSVVDLVQTLMVSGYQHHYPFAYGLFADAGMELCGWIGIQPIQTEKYTHYVK